MDIEIERVISAFELQLRELGFSDDTGALLVQINIGGKSYIMSRGNLNNLSTPTLIHGLNNGINFIDFMESEILQQMWVTVPKNFILIRTGNLKITSNTKTSGILTAISSFIWRRSCEKKRDFR